MGELSKVCSQIVLKCLYLARIGRPDIPWSLNELARSITKWTKACDKRLSRLISYIHHTCEYKQSTKGVLENRLKDQSFHLVHWLSITLSLRKTSQESINLERTSHLDCSSDTPCTRVEFGRVRYWLQTLRSWRRWTHRKSTRKDSMQRK